MWCLCFDEFILLEPKCVTNQHATKCKKGRLSCVFSTFGGGQVFSRALPERLACLHGRKLCAFYVAVGALNAGLSGYCGRCNCKAPANALSTCACRVVSPTLILHRITGS